MHNIFHILSFHIINIIPSTSQLSDQCTFYQLLLLVSLRFSSSLTLLLIFLPPFPPSISPPSFLCFQLHEKFPKISLCSHHLFHLPGMPALCLQNNTTSISHFTISRIIKLLNICYCRHSSCY